MLVGGVPRLEPTNLTRHEPGAAWSGICINKGGGTQRWVRGDRVFHGSVKGVVGAC